MEIQWLKAFLATAEQGSVSEAAEQLHLTQPAVSKRLAALEQQLDTPLFDRIGRRLRLTDAGRALLPRARHILNEVSDAERELRALGSHVSGSLRIATSHHVGLHHLPPVLKTFSARYPDVALDIDFLDSEQAYEALAAGEYELAVVTLALKDYPNLEARVIWPDPCVVVAAPDHPLAQMPVLDIADLARYPAILPDLNTYTGRLIKREFDARGLKLTAKLATNYLETIKMMAGVGLGWSVLPRTLVDDSLAELPVAKLHILRNLGVINHRARTLSNAASALQQLLLATADQQRAVPGSR
ncbi:LysR family transcriptional regulator [Microbulbifer thermotolerans]|uniref:LysR family transcriptional regulator n=1 Tax=Microbulbifer thermotolerans TaxID=252514 RepID=A0A143HKD8_MICTH|nr:LysR family transcriptional regulator [Microbulbifer thermotolerans]AMX02133.1 LysR family transcriptional regulator [Microbulbifer thermotolerans]MCX2778904.1 LysR family transcriptional regulator [Microbulbifer thermotolerans]MCX2793790.1 LysR family transcriptional regulator [Microbulbifer thermotolerans]MCX2804209.1 LysR family transcriptional regulator [Microbulbifer thermotolerans]MCX2830171.1 LysR family transcriptional regulator [Microbulbifer thermotolerans]